MQKICFLAEVAGETGFFQNSEEGASDYESNKSLYKGGGIVQLTGTRPPGVSTGPYNEPGPYKDYAEHIGKSEIIADPGLVAKTLHYCVDSGGWMWSVEKKCVEWAPNPKDEPAKAEAKRWKREHWKKAIGKSLNEIAHLAEEDEEYFWLICKLLNGYGVKQKKRD